MATTIPPGTSNGDILDPEYFMLDGWCNTVDCVDQLNYSPMITEAEFNDAMATKNLCHVGSHQYVRYSSVDMAIGYGPEPSCQEIYDRALTYITIPSGPLYFRHPTGWIMADNFVLTGCGAFSISTGYYANEVCGEYIGTDPNPYQSEGTSYWRAKAALTGTNHLYQEVGEWECPPNSYKDYGTCLPNPGYKYDEDSGEFILIPPGEPGYPPNEICKGFTIRQTIEYDGVFDREDCESGSKIFYISYTGSTLTNGVDFYGPSEVVFNSAGKQTFDIQIFDSTVKYDGLLYVHIEDIEDECPSYFEIHKIKECLPTDNPPDYPPEINPSNCKDRFFWSKSTCEDDFDFQEEPRYENGRKCYEHFPRYNQCYDFFNE